MAATCSDSGLKAMSDAMGLTDRAVIHTVDGTWSMQEFPVEVTHARQRSLTLLELFILKAFNQIPGCTARDIVTQFGLATLLVESTLRTLKLCNTIESVEETVDQNPNQDELHTLNLELKSILDRLAMVGGAKDEQQEKIRRRDVIQQQIHHLEKLTNPDPEDRFSRMKFQVNSLGKEALLKKYLKEPTETKIYSFARCMTTGVIHILGGPNVEKDGIEEGWPQIDKMNWGNEENPKYANLDPSIREIEEVLSSLNPNNEIEINTIEVLASRFGNRQIHLPLHFTLTIANDDKKQAWLVHLQREHIPRVRWIEEHLQELKSQHPRLLKHLANTLPSVKPREMKLTSTKNASPLVRIDRLFSQEANEQGILVVHAHEQLTNLIDLPLQSLDRLLSSRTLVCLSPKLKKNYTFEQSNDLIPPSFTIPDKGIMPKGTIAMSSGYFEVGYVSISFTPDEQMSLPVLCHSKPRGMKTVAKVDAYLRNLLSPEHLFLMTGAPADLHQWLQETVSQISSTDVKQILDEFIIIRNRLHEVAGPLGLPYMHTAVEAFIDTFSNICLVEEDAIAGLLNAIDEAQISPDQKGECWSSIETSLHALAIESSSSDNNTSDLFSLWKAIRQRNKELPWEEMALLENTLLGNCSWTRFEMNRHMERIVKDLTVGNQRPVSDLAGMINDLRSINIIDKKLHTELEKTKAGRNRLTHEHDMDADLTHTLEAIKTLRSLATLTEPIDDNRWSIKDEYRDFSWTFSNQELEQYLLRCHELITVHSDQHQFTQSLWFDSLHTRLPTTYPEIPFETAKIIERITSLESGLDGQALTRKILKEASESWAESLKTPSNYSIPKNVLKSMDRLNEYGLDDEATKIAVHILKEVPAPPTIEALLAEVNMAKETMKVISPMDVIVRWKRTIEQPDFIIELQSLSNAEEGSLDRMGKTNREELLKGALEPYFGKNYTVDSIESGIVKIDVFVHSSETWLPVLNTLENWMFERCIRLLKQGTEKEMLSWLNRMTTKGLEKTSLKVFKMKLEEALTNLKKKIKKAENAKAKPSKKSKKKGGRKK